MISYGVLTWIVPLCFNKFKVVFAMRENLFLNIIEEISNLKALWASIVIINYD